MLAVSALRRSQDEREGESARMEAAFSIGADDFPDFSSGNLLDSIDFDDIYLGLHDGDLLPDLEMDPELLAEFSVSGSSGGCSSGGGGGEDSLEINNMSLLVDNRVGGLLFEDGYECNNETSSLKNEEEAVAAAMKTSLSSKGEEVESDDKKQEGEFAAAMNSSSPHKGSDTDENINKGKRWTSLQAKNSNNNQGKRKVKVDWTPELHRRFVQAVEQLGVDKAVPSRILELMGIDCLTRHNIASHLQKYRSHRKHLLAREAEAANWSHKRQMYGVAVGGCKPSIQPWHAHPPTMGFPPPMPPPMHHPFRPLHVWGHPTMDQPIMTMWPKQFVPSPSPQPPLPPTWTRPPPHSPPADPSLWHSHHQRVPNGLTPATACFPQPLPATRFGAVAPVPGIPPHAMYKPGHGISGPAAPTGPHPHLPLDLHPTKESIDAAIGDVLAKPWQPLPLGLKPPSVDGVLVELQRQGIPKIPPTTTTCA